MDDKIAPLDVGQLVQKDVLDFRAREPLDILGWNQQDGPQYTKHRRAGRRGRENHLGQPPQSQLIGCLSQ